MDESEIKYQTRRKELSEIMTKAEKLISLGRNLLINQGKVIDTNDYLTIKRYCEKYNLKSEAVVLNWIARGIIPKEDVLILTEFNNLKVIPDKQYKN